MTEVTEKSIFEALLSIDLSTDSEGMYLKQASATYLLRYAADLEPSVTKILEGINSRQINTNNSNINPLKQITIVPHAEPSYPDGMWRLDICAPVG